MIKKSTIIGTAIGALAGIEYQSAVFLMLRSDGLGPWRLGSILESIFTMGAIGSAVGIATGLIVGITIKVLSRITE